MGVQKSFSRTDPYHLQLQIQPTRYWNFEKTALGQNFKF